MNEGFLRYRMGLDIGIASVGWAVIENDSNDEPKRIIDLGVRIFDKAEQPKTGESLAAPRRNARTTRRRLRRRRHRLERIRILLEKEGLINATAFMERYHNKGLPCVYKLRYEALERRLSGEELAQILIHIAKHRGFKSTRKAETKEQDGGKVLTATKANEALMSEKGYRTVGEMIYKDEHFKTSAPWTIEGWTLSPRNKQDDYKHTILRDLLEKEVKIIFECQREFGNGYATKELEEAFLEIMLGQRSFDNGPGNQPDGTPSPYGGNLIDRMVGNCTFEKGEQRAAKATYSAERFVLLQKINHTQLVKKGGYSISLTEEQRDLLIKLACQKKELKYSDVRKVLALDEDIHFKGLIYDKDNTMSCEKAKFVSMQWFYQIQSKRGIKATELTSRIEIELIDNIGTILTKYKSDDGRREELSKLDLTEEEIENLIELNPSKFMHLSLKAIGKILVGLECGDIYNVACENAGYNFKNDDEVERVTTISGDILQDILVDITNPVVKRSISQTTKVINAIIRKYGSPQAVHIELAREMSKNFDERKKIDKQYKENCDNNEKVKKQIMEYGVLNPTGQDILKYRLWLDQKETCLYTGNHIPVERLFKTGEYDIDHIIPYSISFDDSYKNKVLVEAGENRKKGNRIPAEYFGINTPRWDNFTVLVNNHVQDYRKRQLLLKEKLTDDDRSGFKERNLTDTKYITTVMYNMLRKNLKFAPFMDDKKKKRVYPVNGAITSYLRKRWGLMQKDRSTDRHHAMDAVVVACCTDGMINKISRNIQGRELAFAYGLKYVDVETGEILNRGESREEWDETYGVKVPLPWPIFRYELEMRMSDNPEAFMEKLTKLGYESWGEIKPIFVSRMPNHKVTGQGHKETIKSAKYYDRGIVVSKTDLTNLKLKDGKIQNYFAPEDDRLLYNALVERLEEFDGDAKKAFAEPFYKPKSNGSKGPLVKKVKIYDKQTSGVKLYDSNIVGDDNKRCIGIAENGSMVRIDVFRDNGKYYFVPIYTADTVKEKLPMRAATQAKPMSEWRVMKDENFIFSLYSRDLVRIKAKKGMKVKYCDKSVGIENDMFVYYWGADIATGLIEGRAHDNSFEFRSLGIQSLEVFEKCQVDVLGNISVVKSETRQPFKKKKG